jgi:hypothetical protein
MKLLGRMDIDDSLKKLDSLTQEEVRMAIAQVLHAINELQDGMKPHRLVPTLRSAFVLLDAKKANEAVQMIANDVGEIKCS